jgi:predicted nucleic acid-binding protein
MVVLDASVLVDALLIDTADARAARSPLRRGADLWERAGLRLFC